MTTPPTPNARGHALTAAGYIVHLTAGGAEALALHAVQNPDLIVSDVAMPGYDGPTLMRALRAGAAPPHSSP